VGGVALLVSFAAGPQAWAQDDVSTRRQEAQDLADSAFDLLQKERFSAAAELFRQADAAFHSPVFVVFQAQATEREGRLVAARALLQKVIDEELAEYAPDAFRQAQQDAKKRIAALDEKIPTITLQVSGGDGAIISLNGEALDAARAGAPLQVDPGSYTVEASNAGRSDSTSVEVAAGDRAVAELDVSDPVAVTGPGPGAGDGGSGSGPPTWVWPTVAYGVGGVGLIMGVAAGGAFLSKQSSLKETCESDGDGDPNTCPPDQQSEGDSVKTLGNVSTAGWVIAGLGAAVGTVLLFTLEDDDGATTALQVGPTSLSLTARF
jgi:hypothetical protein